MDRNEKGSEDAFRLFSSMDRLRKAWKGLSPCRELNKSQFATLRTVSQLGTGSKEPCFQETRPVPLSALASAMGQSLPSLSQRITALEEMGYVKRVPDPDDRRITGVSLSPSGQKLLEDAVLSMNKSLNTVLMKISKPDRELYFAVTEQVISELEKLAETNAMKE